MADTISANRVVSAGKSLTVREIKGLLTRLSHDLVRTLGAPAGARQAEAEAQPIETRRFVESMNPFLKMN